MVSRQQIIGWIVGCVAVLSFGFFGQSLQSQHQPDNRGELFLPAGNTDAIASVSQGKFVNPARGDMRIVVISDLNSAYGSVTYDSEVTQALALMPIWQPDLVLCGGDMVAGQKRDLTDGQIRAMWAAFDQQIAQPLRNLGFPFGFTLGNHDASSALNANQQYIFAKERNLAATYWRSPAHDPGVDFLDKADFPFYYTFQEKDIFFLVWDGSSHHIPAEKLAWVEAALSSPAAKEAKLRILVGHLPLYAVAVGRDKPGEVMKNAELLRKMLEKHDVHTYISGHGHAYYPGYRGNLKLLNTGALGSGPRKLLNSPQPPRKAVTVLDINFTQPNPITYTTYDMKTLAPVTTASLPRFTLGHNGRVLRQDLSIEQLTPLEQADCKAKLGASRCSF